MLVAASAYWPFTATASERSAANAGNRSFITSNNFPAVGTSACGNTTGPPVICRAMPNVSIVMVMLVGSMPATNIGKKRTGLRRNAARTINDSILSQSNY
jgi:hypothetical protein